MRKRSFLRCWSGWLKGETIEITRRGMPVHASFRLKVSREWIASKPCAKYGNSGRE